MECGKLNVEENQTPESQHIMEALTKGAWVNLLGFVHILIHSVSKDWISLLLCKEGI